MLFVGERLPLVMALMGSGAAGTLAGRERVAEMPRNDTMPKEGK